MIIAVHRRGVVVAKKDMGILNRHTISTPRQYIRISPIFIPTFPFNPFYTLIAKPQNYLLTKFLHRQKYIFIFTIMRTDKTIVDRRTNKLFNVRKIIKHNQCCLICLRRTHGTIKKYKTYC
jgi:hypothetical protein